MSLYFLGAYNINKLLGAERKNKAHGSVFNDLSG